MKNSVIFSLIIFIVAAIFLSGCVSKSADKPAEQALPSPTDSPKSSVGLQAPSENSQSSDENKIKELESKVNSMQQQINGLQEKLDRLGLPQPSSKSLIPKTPFRIEVKYAEMQTPIVWTFKENSEVEIRDAGYTEIASYKLDPNNNTIKLSSKKYDFYGLVLYDDYATAIYENGWIVWARKYQIFPPKYNTVTQKYELN